MVEDLASIVEFRGGAATIVGLHNDLEKLDSEVQLAQIVL